MKAVNKLFAVALALIMILSLATTAFAVENTTGTITNDTDRTYNAYQIFSGTQAENGVPLGDIVWGSGIDEENFLEALKILEVNGATPFESCENALDVANVLKSVGDESELAKEFANLAAKHLETPTGTIDANDTVILDSGYYLLIDTSSNHEAQNPALLQVTNDAQLHIKDKSGVPSVEKDVNDNDVNIGDTVTFTLTATMPSTFEGYDSYKVVFHDTMSKGLTYNNDAQVSVEGFTTTTATDAEGNTIITITNPDVLDNGVQAGQVITVTYTATLNENAVIGTNGNPNVVYLEFSNNPNWNGEGDEPTGETPEKEEIIYTWEIPVSKIDGENAAPLSGAKFTLYKDEACTEAVNVVEAGNNIYKVCTLTDCEHTHTTEITTDSTGNFQIQGLEQGTYYLKETKAPAGYNLLTTVVEVTIGANGVIVSENLNANVIVVENNKGAVLPETGGMGTTLFYVIGGLLVAAAVVLLVTKKRMASAE